MISTALLLPTPPALLPPYSVQDTVADLRAACAEAVAGLPDGEVVVVAGAPDEADRGRGVEEPLGHRVARHLLDGRPFVPELALPWTAASLVEQDGPSVLLVMADGSARRTEKAPGHLHPDSVAFDDELERALHEGDAETLARTDPARAAEVWCRGAPALRLLGEVARGRAVDASVTYADAPYGVAWWVARWDLA